jgi:uncharacterized protein (TIRG00374 family)
LKKIQIILYVISIAAIVYFIIHYKDSLSVVLNLNAWELSFLLILGGLLIALQAFQFSVITRVISKNISFLDMLAITSISSMYNYILPASGGGIAVRSALLNRKFNIPWSKVAALMGAFYLSGYFAMALLLLITSSIAYCHLSINSEVYLIAIGFFAILSLFIIFLYRWQPVDRTAKNRLIQFVHNIKTGLDKFKGEYNRIFINICCQIGIIFIFAVKLFFSYHFLEIEITYWNVFLLQSFLSLSLLFSITPGNIGIREGVIVFFAGFLGLSAEHALFGALVDRASSLLIVFLFGLAGKFWYFKSG